MRPSILELWLTGLLLMVAATEATQANDDSAARAVDDTKAAAKSSPDEALASPARSNNPARNSAVQRSTDPSNVDDLSRSEEDADAATLAFVREHQPELAELLQFLKSKRGPDYDSAIKEIRRVRDRLENVKKRDQELHDVELALWKNSAQLRLWAASVSASSKKLSDADHKKLTLLVTRENELTTQRLRIEKARTKARLELLDQQLLKRQDQSESIIAKGIKAWEGRIERPTGKSKNKTPPGEAKLKNTSDRS